MKKLLSLAAGLVGMAVLAIGAGSGRGDGGPIGCGDVPVPVQTFKVHLQRTLGVDTTGGIVIADVDGSNLSAEQVKQLRKLIEDAHFFDLPSTNWPPLEPHILEAPPGWNLTVEMDGRTHSIWVADADVSKSLQALIDALPLCRDANAGIQQGPAATRVEEEQPAVKIDFTMAGGIAFMRWTAQVDSANLSPEDAQKLAKLIADARFFDQPEHFPATEVPDGFGYTITVEMNGKRYTVNMAQDTVPAEMQPLVEWLSSRAVEVGPIGCLPPPPPM
jgi:hypothetical protein